MQKSLAATAVLLLSACIGSAQDKSAIQVTIGASPEQIKKAALTMFTRSGYSIDSETPTQLKISKPFSDEETAAYNTAHWTNQPVANCRHVHTFLMSPADGSTNVTMTTEMVCYYDKQWMIRRNASEQDNQFINSTLAGLKTRIDEAHRRLFFIGREF
jgi:hypothetical protein